MQQAGKELADIELQARQLRERLQVLEYMEKKRTEAIEETAKTIQNILPGADDKAFRAFLEKPYAIIPHGEREVLVAVPKFVDLQVGWLWRETETYNIYQLNQYLAWLGDAPREILELVGAGGELHATVNNGLVDYPAGERDQVKELLKDHLSRVGETEARIKTGHEFQVLADLIENGALPFKPMPVAAADRKPPASKIVLRPYQQRAYEEFMKRGAIGVYYPTGAGKSYIAMRVADELKGPKLVVVPTSTLREQWQQYLEKHFGLFERREFTIVTYNTESDVFSKQWTLVIYDECQRLPANTFSRLATIKAKYRIGLSASPHREDGREAYIFALTGYPLGINWKEYMKETGQQYHKVIVHVLRTRDEEAKNRAVKKDYIAKLIDPKAKTFIFCDSLERGKEIAQKYHAPYVSGETKSGRLDIIAGHRLVVVSRVADLGVSVKDLEHIIEVDFLYGSRQQELQRTGRLMHSEVKDARHDIVMTRSEYERYGKRLWALQEKGFKIELVEEA